MSFLGRWFSDALRLALSLAGAVLLMQAPALSHDYAAALRQVADAQSRDIASRETTACGYYDLQTASEPDLLAALRAREPSNAAGLEQSRAQAAALTASLARIDRSQPLLQPLTAAWDLATAPDGGKSAVAEQAVQSFAPTLQLSASALVWALAGAGRGLVPGPTPASTCAPQATADMTSGYRWWSPPTMASRNPLAARAVHTASADIAPDTCRGWTTTMSSWTAMTSCSRKAHRPRVIWTMTAGACSTMPASSRRFYPNAPAPGAFCAPRVTDGFQLDAIRRRLAQVAVGSRRRAGRPARARQQRA